MPYYGIMFWQRVDRTGGALACWPWQGERHKQRGYTPEPLNGEQRVHRVAWTLLRGPIPQGLSVHHSCPLGQEIDCCNPAHMFLGGVRAKSLFARIDATSPDACWHWLGRISPTTGTGRVRLRGVRWSVHVLMYTQIYNAVPVGMEVAHTCGLRTCVNPKHLYLRHAADHLRGVCAPGKMQEAQTALAS